jgi:hypothetical protein
MRLLSRTLLFVAAAALLVAQTDRGIINGTVNDGSGAAVPDAKVTATNVGTNIGFATQTTSTGDFTIPAMPVIEDASVP